ncbi:hypothetical protein [Sphaerisporangium sp. NPDC051011]|uniref:hypothetical protein n=1 Tax=Sphaerisporangium sp. NPDC051011 TaxID=3155792 RepID=UPI0033EC022B
MNPSPAFHEEVEPAPGATWSHRYRVVVGDGFWDRQRPKAYVRDHPLEPAPLRQRI